jgi:hypothetical protein
MIVEEAEKEVRRLSNLLDAGLDVLRSSAEETAAAEKEYRKARAQAWVQQTEGTAGFKEAQVDSLTADLRYRRDVAEGMRRAALESVRARSTQITLWQSLLAAHRSKAEFARTRP